MTAQTLTYIAPPVPELPVIDVERARALPFEPCVSA